MSVRHVVLLKFKEGVNKEEAADAISKGLNALPDEIKEIKSFSCGLDVGLDPTRNHDYCIVADFANAQDYKVYADHEAHKKVIVESIKVARRALLHPHMAVASTCCVI